MHMACGREEETITGCVRRGVRTWHVLEVILTEPKPGAHVFDLGQNFSGWIRLKVSGKTAAAGIPVAVAGDRLKKQYIQGYYAHTAALAQIGRTAHVTCL